MTRLSRVTWGVVTATGVVILAALGLLAPLLDVRKGGYFLAAVAFAVSSSGLGLMINRKEPSNKVGLLVALFGFVVPFFMFRDILWWVLETQPAAFGWNNGLQAFFWEAGFWVSAVLSLLFLYFPDGELPSRRWRWLPAAVVLDTLAIQVEGMFGPSSYAPLISRLPEPLFRVPETVAGIWDFIAYAMALVLPFACASALIVKYRRADWKGRAQLKWMALVALAIPVLTVLAWTEGQIFGEVRFVSKLFWLLYAGVAVAATIAIVRHDLYDIDKAIVATITYGTLTALLVSVYTAASFAAGVTLGRDSAAVAAGTTAICAALLSGTRRRLRRAVDRRFYPFRRAVETELDALNARIHAGEAAPEKLEETLRRAMRDSELRVGYRVPGGSFVDAEGKEVPADRSIPITLAGVDIGILVPGDGQASRELLREVAQRAAIPAEMVRLRLELSEALREAESSRARLVQAGDRERRRLERDLHDGAQQRLVSLGMGLRLAQRHLGDGTVDVNGLLDQSVAEIGDAVDELRQIAHGLRPSTLDDGLPAALLHLAEASPAPIELDIQPDRLPDDVAVTVYYVAAEAVTNAIKHSEADNIRVRVERSNGAVNVRIEDDGKGGAQIRGSTGLTGLADRVSAMGGSLAVQSPVGKGTVVEATIPCAS